MSWEVKFNAEKSIVEAICRGTTTGKDLREMTSKCIALGDARGTCEFLIDAHDVEFFASLTEFYNIPAKQFLAEGLCRSSRIALIQPASQEARFAARFFENACRKRSWNVLLFSCREDAVDWLVKQERRTR